MDVITVSNVTKSFKIYKERSSTLKDRIIFHRKNNFETYTVLDNISLSVGKGETVGLIGRNGSGKSTLLKLLTGILYPDNGTIKCEGKISSLLELGAGFHPDFTGRENIFMNASILGLSKKQIRNKLNDIIAFSELEEFIENPVRTYSSGMYMRLAFSVAIMVEPDVLLVDEVLAVGDSAFQTKCLNMIRKLKAQGTTIVIVTHDNGIVEKLCDKVVWLHNGQIKEIGLPREVVLRYMLEVSEIENNRLLNEDQHRDDEGHNENEGKEILVENEIAHVAQAQSRWGNKKIELVKVALKDDAGQDRRSYNCGQSMNISIDYKVNQKVNVDEIVFGIGIFTHDNICCYGTNTYIDRKKINALPNEGKVIFKIKELNLVPGEYLIDIAVHKENGEPFDYQTRKYSFQVYSDLQDVGIARLPHDWEIVETVPKDNP